MSLTTEELSLLREEAVVWQTDRCNILRFIPTNDAYGGHGDLTEDVVATGVPCTIDTGAGHEQTIQAFGLERERAGYIVYVPAETDVRVGDHLVVTTKGNEHLRVQAVMAPETHEIERMLIASSLTEHNV